MTVDQQIGEALDWTPAQRPARRSLRGSHVLVRPVDAPADAESLHSVSRDPAQWTYLPDGPYESPEQLQRMLAWAARSEAPLFFTLATLPGERPAGMASYLRMAPEHGTIEIGHIWLGTPLRRTTAAS